MSNAAKVTFKSSTVEDRHFHHSLVTWTQAPPGMAFAYVSDIPRHNEWAENEVRITPLTPGPARLGSKYEAVGHQAGKDWPSQLEVTGFEPARRFEFTATGGPVGTPDGDPHRHVFLFTPQNGGTELEVQRVDPVPPNWPFWLYLVFATLVRPFLLRGPRTRTIESLRNRLDLLAGTAQIA